MTGITRNAAARIIAKFFGTEAVHVGGSYDTYTVVDQDGRRWKVVCDASICCQARGERSASHDAYFKSADHSLPVCDIYCCITFRIEFQKLLSERLYSFDFKALSQTVPQLKICLREIIKENHSQIITIGRTYAG